MLGGKQHYVLAEVILFDCVLDLRRAEEGGTDYIFVYDEPAKAVDERTAECTFARSRQTDHQNQHECDANRVVRDEIDFRTAYGLHVAVPAV